MSIFDKFQHFTLVDEAKSAGVYPYFHVLETRQDKEVVMEGKRKIMLGSNNYLGLTTNSEVVEAGVNALKHYGSGCSGSRFLNGTLDLHVKLEEQLARFLEKQAAVTFSTGFQANLGIISAVVGRNDYILCDKENHASIYDGCRLSYGKMLRFEHSNMGELENLLKNLPTEAGKLIITDGVFSMSGDIANLPKIVELGKKYNAQIMVDDAHGFGVLGNCGKGTADYFGLTEQVDIIMGTFSKSLASLGGYMVADKNVVEYVKHRSRPFIFSASIQPASCATASKALEIIEKSPNLVKHLNDIADFMRQKLDLAGIKYHKTKTPIIPIYTNDTMTTLKIAKTLFDRGVYVNPVLPPATPEHECLIRTSLMTTHTKEIIEEAVEIISQVLKEEKVQ